jgi:glycosyltransferase involved in cell wall biosynthesis
MLQEGRYDVVHSHSPYTAGLVRLVARSLPPEVRPSLIATEHVPWQSHPRSARFLNRTTYRLDAADIAVSRAVRDSVPPSLRRGVQAIVHGIDLPSTARAARHHDTARTELGLTDGEVVVGTVANYRRQKGYPDLLAAARRVIDSGVPVRFVAIGQGPLEAEIVARHRALRLGDRFLLLGYRENPSQVLAGCDLFVLSSLWEGLPLVVMEALALGLPVVATSVGGTPEAITNGVEGLLVPPSRPDLLADAILELVRDPERRKKMATAALARAVEFDVGRAIASIEAIYREAALQRRQGKAAGGEGTRVVATGIEG